jgi:ubiquitin-like 1-activating enzyme E1 A
MNHSNSTENQVLKNLVLAGIGATVVDPEAVRPEDLASNFFLDASDIGSNRAMASLPRIRELNKYATVEGLNVAIEGLSDDFILGHNVVVLTHATLSQQVRVNALCRSQGKAFYTADVFGYSGILFVDLGSHCYRTESGTGASSKLSDPMEAVFPSLEEAMSYRWAKLATKRFGPVSPIFAHARILAEFRQLHGRPATAGDAAVIYDLGTRMLEENGANSAAGPNIAVDFTPADAQLLATTATVEWLLFGSVQSHMNLTLAGQAEVSPVCAILGGVLGQEIVKFVSAKGSPIGNFFVLNALGGEGKVPK